MHDEDIINVVEQRRALYDKANPKFSQRGLVNALWEECAGELGVEVKPLKKRWSFLRYYFVAQYKIVKSKRRGIKTTRRKKWPLYDRMKFLLPYLQESEPEYEVEPIPTPQVEDNNAATVYQPEKKYNPPSQAQGNNASPLVYYPGMNYNPTSHVIENNSHMVFYPGRKYNPPNANHFNDAPTQVEMVHPSQPTEYVDNDMQGTLSPKRHKPTKIDQETESPTTDAEEDDEDAHFLRSLLPTMYKLDPITRLEFRIEVQSLLLRCQKKTAIKAVADTEISRKVTISTSGRHPTMSSSK